MPQIANKCKAIPRSAIREMAGLSTGLDNLVSFALGEPDFDTPAHIIEAGIASYQRGETHYTPNAGIMPLREAVAQTLKNRGLNYEPEEVLITSGAINALLLSAFAILDAGDEVIIANPGWANYHGLIMQVGAVPVPVSVYEENGFNYDIADLRTAVTDKTKAIFVNSPSNPTGGVAGEENLRRIAQLAIEKDLFIITDEIYRQLLYTEEPYFSIAEVEGMKERTIIIDGVSKSYAMTGWRVGFAAAPEEVVIAMTKLLENVVSSVNEAVQWGAVAALTGDQQPVREMLAEYSKRRALIIDGLNSVDGISCKPPKGAFYAFANIKKTGLNSKEFAVRLLEQEHVVVVPGTGFGINGEGFVRLSYATSEEMIREGLARIRKFTESLK